MVVFSKAQFYEAITPDVTCTMLHPWTKSCSKAFLFVFLQCFQGSFKFLLPLWLLRILYNYKRINKKMLMKQIIFHLRTTLFFTGFGATLLGSNCLLRKFFGKFHYYTIGLLAGMIAGVNIFTESKEYRLGKALLFTNLCLENMVRHLESKNLLKRTEVKETLLFSTFTSILMYLFNISKGSQNLSTLWFYRPKNYQKNKNNKHIEFPAKDDVCLHAGPCTYFAFKGFYTYFGIGYLMELLKNVLRYQTQLLKNPKLLYSSLINEKNIRFGLFFGGFVGVYESLVCCLRKKFKKSENKHSLIAGFLAGICYYFKPSFPFVIMAFTTIAQLFLLEHKEFFEVVPGNTQWPLMEMYTAVIIGILIHQRLLHADICVNYLIKALDMLSNKRITEVYNSITHVLFPNLIVA